jgi:hypothetical protein
MSFKQTSFNRMPLEQMYVQIAQGLMSQMTFKQITFR